MLKLKGKQQQKVYKTDWTLKNVKKDDDKSRTECKRLDIKLGSNSTKW